MYVVHLSLESFVRELALPATVRMQVTVREHHAQGLPTGEQHRLTLTAEVGDLIHAVRLEVAALSRLRSDEEIKERRVEARAHTQAIIAALTHYFTGRKFIVAGGMLLAPGLREDLDHVGAGQEAWKIVTAKDSDPPTRTLVWNEAWNPLAS